MAFSPDNNILASSDSETNIRLWDVKSGEELRTLKEKSQVSGKRRYRTFEKCHPETIASVIFSPDCQTLASGDDDGTVMLWDVKKGELSQKYYAGSSIGSIAFSPDGRIMATGFECGAVDLRDVRSGKVFSNFTVRGKYEVYYIIFSPDSRSVACGLDNGSVEIRDIKTCREIAFFRGYAEIEQLLLENGTDRATDA